VLLPLAKKVGGVTWKTDTIMRNLNPVWDAFFPDIPV
jgi:hypothetical protein